MNIFKFAMPAVLSLMLLTGAPAVAAEDPSHYLLTPALIDKLRAAETDMKALAKPDEAAIDDSGDQSIEASIQKFEKDAPTVAVLAKHDLTSSDLVLSAHALLHAGMHVSMEASMDKKKSTKMLAGYTKEQKANVELVRALTRQKK